MPEKHDVNMKNKLLKEYMTGIQECTAGIPEIRKESMPKRPGIHDRNTRIHDKNN